MHFQSENDASSWLHSYDCYLRDVAGVGQRRGHDTGASCAGLLPPVLMMLPNGPRHRFSRSLALFARKRHRRRGVAAAFR